MKPMFAITLLTLSLCSLSVNINAAAPPGHPAVDASDRALHAPTNNTPPNQGMALEVIQTEGYTYIHVEKKDTTEWIAVATLNAVKGDIIQYSAGSPMANFHSKSLNRTFPEILFAGVADFVSGKHPSIAETASILNIADDKTELTHQGKVVSTIPSSMYIYIEVSQDGMTRWLAAPLVELKTGDEIQYGDGAVMTEFYSKSLDREFAEIVFISKAVVVK